MIDINEVEKLEKAAIVARVAREKKDQEESQRWHRQQHEKLLKEMEKGREAAEKELPKLLKEIEQSIAEAIESKRTTINVSCGGYNTADQWKLTYTKIMLIQMLPLKGLACNLSQDEFRNVVISW